MTHKLSLGQIVIAQAERESLQPDWDRQRKTAQVLTERFEDGFDTMLLADEVGMGKTYVALSVISHHVLQEKGKHKKALLLVPPSSVLKAKWEQEILSFNDRYLTESARTKGLRPALVNSYWDLLRNLHDHGDVTGKQRIHMPERDWFIYCLFEWARSRGRVGKRPGRWPVIAAFDEDGPDYFRYCSQYSVQSLWRFLDAEYESRSHWFAELFRQLKTDQFESWWITNLVKDFGPQQSRFEPNVLIMGMNALNRPRVDQSENKLLIQYMCGFLLSRRQEKAWRRYIEGLEKANVLPAKGSEHWCTYISRMAALSSGDFHGLRSVVESVVRSDEVRAKWDALGHDIDRRDHNAVHRFVGNLLDTVFRTKLAHAGIGLAVVDEVHNWKNGRLGAAAFKTNCAPSVPQKLIMSATPFQLGEEEMSKVFGYVSHPQGKTTAAVTSIFAANGPAAHCLEASHRFAVAWKAMSRAPSGAHVVREIFGKADAQALPALVTRVTEDLTLSEELRMFTGALARYRSAVTNLQDALRAIMVRHTKPREKRDFQSGADFGGNRTGICSLYPTTGYASEEDALINFAGMRLDQLVRRQLRGNAETNARLLGGITSSTQAFRESAGYAKLSSGSGGVASAYLSLFERLLDSRLHPKVALTVERAFKNFREGRKTLIFCERIATIGEITKQLQSRISAHLAEQSSDEGQKRATLLKNAGFVDNIWWTSLGLALSDQRGWISLHEENLPRAEAFAREQLTASGIMPSPRRIIRLLDLFLVAKASQAGLIVESHWHYAGRLYEKLLEQIQIASSEENFGLLREYLNAGAVKATPRIEEQDDEETAADIDEVVQRRYRDRQNLWHVEDGRLHQLLWDLIGSEAKMLAQSEFGNDADRSLAFMDILTDLMEGLRKVVLRDDLIRRYAASSTGAESGLERVRDGFIHMEIGHGETMLTRVKRFLHALLDHNGSISQAGMQNSKRKSLWQGVFQRDTSYVRIMSGVTDSATRVTLCAAFNSPLLPDILVCSAIGSEGIDLHRYCSEVIHHDLPWNPAKLEQRIGRLDRVGSLADSAPGLKIDIGIPFLEHNYEKFQYDVVFSRAQKFEVLMGKPEYHADDPGEEDFGKTEDHEQVVEGNDAEAGTEDEVLLALPDTIIRMLAVDLTVARECDAERGQTTSGRHRCHGNGRDGSSRSC